MAAKKVFIALLMIVDVALAMSYPQRKENTATCNGDVVDLTGTTVDQPVVVKSPVSKNGVTYPPNTRCRYFLNVPAGRKANIKILKMDLKGNRNRNCRGDFLMIEHDDSFAKECGKISKKTFETKELGDDSQLRFYFKSNRRKQRKGFLIHAYLTDSATTTTITTQSPGPISTPSDNDKSFQCGISIENRIIGGEEADPFSIPWQVGLLNDTHQNCGGTLISPIHVLTAAHCTAGLRASSLGVFVGEHDLQSYTDGILHAVDCKSDHPNYDSIKSNYDFSILTLKFPVDISSTNSKARPACLPSNVSRTYVKDILTVSGWGKLSENGFGSRVLHHAQIPGVSNAICRASSSYPITDQMLCAGQPSGGIDSCDGDSGGPLTFEENGVTSVVGVISWGIGCAREGNYGVYSRVTEVLDWINSHGIQDIENKC